MLYLLVAALKFIGIAILVLLLLLLLLVIIILTVPIKYSVYLNKSEEIDVNASVTWLYSMVGLDIIYNSKSEMIKRFKLFGKVIIPKQVKKKEKSQEQVLKEAAEKVKMEQMCQLQEPVEIEKVEEIEVEIEKIEKVEEKSEKPKKNKKSKKEKKQKEEKDSFKEKFDKLQSFTYKRELFEDTLVLIKRLLKRILPSTLYLEVEIGKEDPADTGLLIAKVAAFYPLYYSFATISGNYEKECFYVKLDASGYITLGKLIYEIIKYIRKTSVKQLIKFIRKDRKGKNHGREVTK